MGIFSKYPGNTYTLSSHRTTKPLLGEMEPLWEGWREECSLQSSDQVPLLYSCREQPLKPTCYKISASPGPCHAGQDASPIQGCLLLKQFPSVDTQSHRKPVMDRDVFFFSLPFIVALFNHVCGCGDEWTAGQGC